jgi:hypothetical protein
MDLGYTLDNLSRIFDSTRNGLERLHEIVAGLRDFSRLGEAGRKASHANEWCGRSWRWSATTSGRRSSSSSTWASFRRSGATPASSTKSC